ncbi:MAG: hypothetical protein C5S38_00325 [Candidatus Methanophagaceae archaeon]|nr:MAG: hypothetical protein C5S38_00325 [Methanophagales archaeon]
MGIAVDSSGNVFVTDAYINRIQKFDSNGNFITKWGCKGSGEGEFESPCDIAVDNSGNVFVADSFNMRIQKFAPSTPQPNQPPTLSTLKSEVVSSHK